MQVKIGLNIKQLRLANDLTQEGLATILNVSSQAISRWENRLTYPDISMLPSIALYFKVSVDELLGMNELRDEASIRKIYREVHSCVDKGDYDKAIQQLREALKLYPEDYGFMSELALLLTIQDNDRKEGIGLSERVLKHSVDDKLKSTVKANLCFLYKREGMLDEAIKIGRSLPHIWESREVLLSEISSTDPSKAINMIIHILYLKVKGMTDDEISKMLTIGLKSLEKDQLRDHLQYICDHVNIT